MVEQERIAAYLFSLEKDMPVFLDKLEQHALERHVPIIRRSTQQILRFLMAVSQPKEILEVGTAIGFSGIFMLEYLNRFRPDGHLTTIEKVSYRIEEAAGHFKAAGFDKQVTQMCGDAKEILPCLVSQGNTYNLIFMDAAKGQYIHFYPAIKELLSTGGLLVSDNVLQDGTIIQPRYSITRRDRTIHARMREYLYTLSHDEDFETITLPMGDGLTLSYKL